MRKIFWYYGIKNLLLLVKSDFKINVTRAKVNKVHYPPGYYQGH